MFPTIIHFFLVTIVKVECRIQKPLMDLRISFSIFLNFDCVFFDNSKFCVVSAIFNGSSAIKSPATL